MHGNYFKQIERIMDSNKSIENSLNIELFYVSNMIILEIYSEM